MSSIQTILDQYMCDEIHAKRHLGLSLGYFDGQRSSYFNYGVFNGVPISENHFFEVASISKVFTSLLILNLENEGFLSINDYVERFVPEFSIKKLVQVQHLLTHTSGLGREPSNFKFIAPENSYLAYTDENLLEALADVQIDPNIFGSFSYSNFGYILLGLIARRASTCASFKSLLTTKILNPLGLKNTLFDLSPEQYASLCWGHSPEMLPIPPYRDLGNTFSSAGALIMTTKELTEAFNLFLRPEIDELNVPMSKILELQRDRLGNPVSYGMHVRLSGSNTFFYHPGSIAGHKCSIVFSPQLKKLISYNTTTLKHVGILWKLFEEAD